MVVQVFVDFGGFDIFVNCVGVISIYLVVELIECDWDFVMNVNVKGMFFGCWVVFVYLKVQGCGWIINVVLIVGKEGFLNFVYYSVLKFVVVGFINVLVKEFVCDGVIVNVICFGIVCIYMWDWLFDEWKIDGELVEQLWQWYQLMLILQGCVQMLEDMGWFVLFFVMMDNVMGQVVNVDGGFMFY